MKKLICIFGLLFSLNGYSIDLKTTYICTAEISTGFVLNKDKWTASQISENDFLIRKLKEDDPGFNSHDKTPYGVFELGETVPAMFCSIRGFVLECSGLGKLDFASRTGRFIRTNTLNYTGDEEDAILQPKVTGGTCKALPPDYKEPPKKVYPPKL